MIDTASVDLLSLIRQDVPLRRLSSCDGGEYHGPCPFCGGLDRRDADRFVVWPRRNRYWCRKCGRAGDPIDYVMARQNLTFPEACARLGLALGGNRHPRRPSVARSGSWNTQSSPLEHPGRRLAAGTPPTVEGCGPDSPLPLAEPPGSNWQARAGELARECAARLWQPEGARACDWLIRCRGLSAATIRAAGLGYNSQDRSEPAAAWGLRDRETVFVPRGVTLPWYGGGMLWRLNVRRSRGAPKYLGPAGSGNGLYGADALTRNHPAVLLEGEIDALSVIEACRDLATVVATGSTAGSRRAQWIDLLCRCPLVLVAFDADEAGEQASGWWLDRLPNAFRWRPYYAKDINGMLTAGGDVRAWLAAGLDYSRGSAK